MKICVLVQEERVVVEFSRLQRITEEINVWEISTWPKCPLSEYFEGHLSRSENTHCHCAMGGGGLFTKSNLCTYLGSLTSILLLQPLLSLWVVTLFFWRNNRSPEISDLRVTLGLWAAPILIYLTGVLLSWKGRKKTISCYEFPFGRNVAINEAKRIKIYNFKRFTLDFSQSLH